MRKLFQLLFFAAILYSVFASAAASMQVPSSINLGEHSRNKTVSSTATITNDGNVTLTNIIPFSTASSAYNLQFAASGFTLSAGASRAVGFNLTIPYNADTGNTTIGSIFFNSDEFNSSGILLSSLITGGLNIADLDVTLYQYHGLSQYVEIANTKTLTDVTNNANIDFGDADYRIVPGSRLAFDFSVENIFTDSDDVTIEGVSATLTVLELDEGEDVDFTSEEKDLDPDETNDFLVNVDIPLKVKSGRYDVEARVEGVDEDGNNHIIEWNLEFDVDKEPHDIFIESLSLSEETVSCSRSMTLSANIMNLGQQEEREFKIEAKSAEIGLDYAKSNLFLSDDPDEADYEYSALIPVAVGKNIRPGTYPITLTAYVKNTIPFVSKTVNLIVKACSSDTADELPQGNIENKNKTVAEPEKTGQLNESGVVPVIREQEKTVTTEKIASPAKAIIIISSAVTLLIVIGTIVVVALILKRRK